MSFRNEGWGGPGSEKRPCRKTFRRKGKNITRKLGMGRRRKEQQKCQVPGERELPEIYDSKRQKRGRVHLEQGQLAAIKKNIA